MDRFIPRQKLGKRARKRLDAQSRATWSFSPTTRRVESKKHYNRKRKSHERMEYGVVGFLWCALHGQQLGGESPLRAWQ